MSLTKKVIDHILFNDEIDLLLARMEILSPCVSEFRIYESGFTFQGKAKPLHAILNKSLFAEYGNRVTIYSNIEAPHKDPWVNEQRARNRIKPFYGAINMLSDVDEIPSRSVMEMVYHLDQSRFPVTNMQDFFYYDIHTKWLEPCACTVFFLDAKNINRLRTHRRRHTKINGGWHFSYFGGSDQIKNKLSAFSHTEVKVTDEALDASLKSGFDFIKSGKRGTLVRLENSDLPEYAQKAMANFPVFKPWL